MNEEQGDRLDELAMEMLDTIQNMRDLTDGTVYCQTTVDRDRELAVHVIMTRIDDAHALMEGVAELVSTSAGRPMDNLSVSIVGSTLMDMLISWIEAIGGPPHTFSQS